MAGGRPSNYTPELGDLICEGVSERKSLVKICNDDSMPAPRTVYSWLRKHPEFLQNYEQAKEDQADAMVEDMLQIADDEVAQPLIGDNGKPVLLDGSPVMVRDAVGVAHARLRVDTRKWAASKFKSKKYGEKSTTVHEGNVGLTDMTEDSLDQKLQQLVRELEQSTRD